MKCNRIQFPVDVVKYEQNKGLEDGFELWHDVVTHGWIVTENLVRIERPDGSVVSPFIVNRRGKIFIGEGDYIIIEHDGNRYVCGEDKVWKRFTPVE